jgi:hypothetical protein
VEGEMSQPIIECQYVFKCSDGSEWAVPVRFIAENRAENYALDEFDGDAKRSLEEDTIPLFEDNPFEIEDWARNNLNWEDVKKVARKIEDGELDMDEEWCNPEETNIMEPTGTGLKLRKRGK